MRSPDKIRIDPERLAEIRIRLSDISWWTRMVAEKQGAIAAELAPILVRLGVEPANWLQLAGRFGRLFHVVAGGPESLEREQARCEARGRPRRRSYHAPGRRLLSGPAR